MPHQILSPLGVTSERYKLLAIAGTVLLISSLLAPQTHSAEWNRAQMEKILTQASQRKSSANLVNRDLTGLDLSGVDFRAANMRSATFKYIQGRDTIKGLKNVKGLDEAIFDE